MKKLNGYELIETYKRTGGRKMKTSRGSTISALLAIVAIMLFVPGAVLAAGTAANTTITNNAVLTYTVGASGAQTVTGTVDFLVDEKIIFTAVKTTDAANLAPGTTGAWVSYTVANQGNSTVGFVLDFVEDSDNMTGGFAPAIYIDANADGLYDAGDTLYVAGTNAFDVAADANAPVVFIVGDVPATALNAEFATYRLKAQATDAGTITLKTETGGADSAAAVETVLADADSDGVGADAARDNTYYSDTATFTVTFAVVTATKTIVGTVWDPYNFNDGTQKAIPGAYVEYQLVLSNAGPGSAVLSTLVDTPGAGSTIGFYLDTDLATATPTSSISLTDPGVTVTCDNVGRACNGATVNLIADANNADGAVMSGSDLSLTLTTILEATAGPDPVRLAGELLSGETVTLRYMVLVTP